MQKVISYVEIIADHPAVCLNCPHSKKCVIYNDPGDVDLEISKRCIDGGVDIDLSFLEYDEDDDYKEDHKGSTCDMIHLYTGEFKVGMQYVSTENDAGYENYYKEYDCNRIFDEKDIGSDTNENVEPSKMKINFGERKKWDEI